MISDHLEGTDQPPGSLTSSLEVVIYCFDVRIEILVIENLHIDIQLQEGILECDLYTCIWPASMWPNIFLIIPRMYISFLKSIIVFYFFRVCQKMTATLAPKLLADSGTFGERKRKSDIIHGLPIVHKKD